MDFAGEAGGAGAFGRGGRGKTGGVPYISVYTYTDMFLIFTYLTLCSIYFIFPHMGIPAKTFSASLSDFISESVGFLKAMEPEEGYYVGFSGGKDSITTLALCRLAGVKHQAFYVCTRIDPPEVMRFIRKHYPEVSWLYSKESFWELIQRKMPPMPMRRWCCDALKKEPSKNVPLKYRLMGIRAEESARRASRPRIDHYRSHQVLLKPIFHWPEWAVWEFIDHYQLPYPSLYDEGFHRIGCVVCPFILRPGRTRQQSMERWPGIWKAFEHAVKRWFNAKMADGLRMGQRFATADEFWQAYINGGSLRRLPPP